MENHPNSVELSHAARYEWKRTIKATGMLLFMTGLGDPSNCLLLDVKNHVYSICLNVALLSHLSNSPHIIWEKLFTYLFVINMGIMHVYTTMITMTLSLLQNQWKNLLLWLQHAKCAVCFFYFYDSIDLTLHNHRKRHQYLQWSHSPTS